MENKSFTFEEIKQKLMNYCVYQDRCHYEVQQKMKDYLLIPEAKDEIILYLLKENYLNEERFTRSYIRGKFYIKHWGRIKIKNALKQKNITEKLIQRCFDEIDVKDYEKEIGLQFDNYYSKMKGLREYQKKSKTIRHLLSRGFEYQFIEEYIRSKEP